MANKFQKSIQQRMEQEAVSQKEATKVATVNPPEPVKRAALPSQTETAPAAPLRDIGVFLRREPERLAKNKTFYLDVQVIEALHAAATEQGVTDSKLCNDILRSVLRLN